MSTIAFEAFVGASDPPLSQPPFRPAVAGRNGDATLVASKFTDDRTPGSSRSRAAVHNFLIRPKLGDGDLPRAAVHRIAKGENV
ncbi:hypothetical protein [Aureimonas endophytica]|uniref:hypothetical protein n=1 Tax=Aureimonas endophytica TaxID=2027858 RepID=UPI00166EE559|nr:hypothetical protein [Aureimonas endophytica]